MDDRSFLTRSCREENAFVTPPLHCSINRIWSRLAPPRVFKNCLNLSWCVFVLVTLPVNVPAQVTPPNSRANVLVSESLRYRMLSGTVAIGQVLIDIKNNDTEDFVYVVESATGLLERTTTLFLRKDSSLSSHASHTIITKSSLAQEIQLRYDAQQVQGSILRLDKSHEPRKIAAKFSARTEDYYIVPYFFRSCVLKENAVYQFPIYEASRNRVELARGWVVKLEEIEVPVGKFECYRLEGFTGKLRWISFFEKEFPHRLLKQKFPALYLETELVEIVPDTSVGSRNQLGSILQR